MGADVVYTYKKLLPRMLVVLILWSVSVFIPFIFNLPPWTPFWFMADFAIGFAYIVIEFRRASKLVKDAIENVSVSDLTKAIYWLSIVSSRKVPSSQDFRYHGSVTKVVHKIGGNFNNAWQEFLKEYNLPNPMMSIYVLIGIFVCTFGIVLAEFLNTAFSWIFLVPIVILFIAFSIIHKKERENVESLIASEQSTKKARWLAQELIFWVSERTTKPVKVMLAEDNYSNVRIADTVYGAAVAEIEPKARIVEGDTSQELSLTLASKEYKPLDVGHEKWEPLWITLAFIGFVSSLALLEISVPFLNLIYQLFYGLAGDVLTLIATIAVVSLPFIPIELFFRRKHLTSSIPVLIVVLLVFLGIPILEWVGLSEKIAWRTFFSTSIIVAVTLFAVFVYFGWPFFKIVFRGGVVKASDLEEVVRRFPARVIRRAIKQDGRAKERFEFLITLYTKESIIMSEVPESIKEWISEDAKQPQSLRYFLVTRDSVSLTEFSKPAAKVLRKKLGASLV